VAAKAWPYAVTRGETSGYQAIVVPAFLAEDGLTYVLEYASRQETDEPGAVTVRDLIGAGHGPLSLAYRVTEARAADYGLGDGLLEDAAGRAIRVFEGLVLRIPAERIRSIGLTAADLDVVTSVTVPAFRKLWMAGTSVDAEPSTEISVGGGASGSRPLNVQIAEPYVAPDDPVPPRTRRDQPRPRRDPPRTRRDQRRPRRDVDPVARSADHDPAGTRPPRTRLITAVVIVGVLAALLGWYVTRPAPSPPTLSTTVSQLCADLSGGKDSDAYQQFSAAYRHGNSLAAFETSLLGTNTRASCTPGKIDTSDDQATLSLRLADGSTKSAHLDFQEQSDRWQVTKMTVSR
jgi:hypothetical protein